MEGNEPNKYEDDELNPGSGRKEESDSDSFGLPDFEAAASESYEDSKEEDSYSFDESYASESSSGENKEEDFASQADESDKIDYGYEQPVEESNIGISEGYEDSGIKEEAYKSTYYEEEYKRTKSPIGWVLLFIFVLIAVIVAIFWWLNRDQKPEVVVRDPVVTQPKITAPPVEEKQEDVDLAAAENEKDLAYEPGDESEIIVISEATNRYYVIVASAIDDDLLTDYAKKLSKEGKMSKILAPRGKTKFYRLAIADFESLKDAALSAEEFKSDFGQDVWVKRY